MSYTLGEITAPTTQPSTSGKSSWFSDFSSGFNQLAPGIAQVITSVRTPRNQITNNTSTTSTPSTSAQWMRSPVVWIAGAGLLAVVLLSRRK
jgi:hypothetical protein